MALPPPTVIDMDEQASGGYWATFLDESGQVVPGNLLTTLTLTLYVLQSDGTIVFLNNRNKQNVLNANDVSVYPTLQARADSKTFNLFWQIRQEDTTIVDDTLATEQHIALFEWSWPNNHFGKQELILAVKNLIDVP